MANKVTERASVSRLESDAQLLITQTETVQGEDVTALRRVPVEVLAEETLGLIPARVEAQENAQAASSRTVRTGAEADLDLADDSGNVLARFAGGHVKTKNFDSSQAASAQTVGELSETVAAQGETLGDLGETVSGLSGDVSDLQAGVAAAQETASRASQTKSAADAGDLDITDASGNVLARFENGHVKTRHFDSSAPLPATVRPTDGSGDLELTDVMGNVLVRFSGGNIQTQKFDSTDPFEVPAYYHAGGYLRGKCDRVNALARACGKISDTFAFFTDLHWHLNAGKSPALLRYIRDHTRIDKFFCGGDVCDFIDSEHQPYDAFTNFYDALRCPIYTAMGNHDYMSSYGTEGRLYYSFNSVGRDRIGNFDRNYFYLDNPQSKIRYIFLNGFAPGANTWAWGYEEAQLTWLAQTALNLDSGWGAIVVTHMTHSLSGTTVTRPTLINTMLAVLDAYDGPGEIIAVISGHTHYDYLDATDGGIPILVTTCDKNQPWVSNGTDEEPWLDDRAAGTLLEQAIDAFIVDRDAKTITRVRVGCPIRYGVVPESWTEYEEVTTSYARS